MGRHTAESYGHRLRRRLGLRRPRRRAGVQAADSAFAGGTKQDDNCATVGTQKAPNKDDLKRYYLASKTDPVSGDIFLALAWARIDQNTTSASAHVGFEFNQSDTACPAGSDDLVERTAGDLLFVYDFEGGGEEPVITVREWVTTGACEVGSSSPPCWGPAADLTAGGFAEAEVNVGTSVLDQVADPDETLNDSEFGETIINLSDAGVFDPDECIAFGKTFAVSRSSGNSAQAQMKDLVGPADINIQNCGSIIINKQTIPSPDATNTSFNYTTTGGLVPPTFSLVDGGSENFQSPEIQAGTYSVTESDPGPNFALTAINCTSSGTSTFTTNVVTRAVSIDLDATDTVECTFVNTLQVGALQDPEEQHQGWTSVRGGCRLLVRRLERNGQRRRGRGSGPSARSACPGFCPATTTSPRRRRRPATASPRTPAPRRSPWSQGLTAATTRQQGPLS